MMILGEDNFRRLKASTSAVSNNKITYNKDGKSAEGMDVLLMVMIILIFLLIYI